ncbi:MAG: hypothetical protein WD342_05805 [Verrucomicrobiales bacterium]
MIASDLKTSDTEPETGGAFRAADSDGSFDRFERIAAEFGTPFYLYDAAKIERQIETLSSLLPVSASPRLLYSFKSNPLPSVAAEMKSGGCEADLTSAGEIAAAVEAGFDLSTALYGGPGKSLEELLFAVGSGIRHFSVESEHDLATLRSAAAEHEATVKGLLRINPLEAPRAKLSMSGVASQFGFEEEELRSRGREILERAGDAVSIVGVHVYWGTQIGDPGALLDCFSRTVKIAEKLSVELGFALDIVNFGGGFPWPYSHVGEGPDLSPLREGLERLHAESGLAGDAEWWFESGRYLAAPSGTLVARVMDVKVSKDEKRYLVLDTGIHHLGGMAGLGRIPRFSIDLEVSPGRRSNPTSVYDVVGQLCTPLDCIGRRIEIPTLEIGDLVAIPNTGAYGPTASVSGFLSRPSPAEVLHRDGEILAVHRLNTGHSCLQ